MKRQTRQIWKNLKVILVLVATFIVLFPVPYVAVGYFTTLFAIILMYINLVNAWNLFSGFSGYISFGHHAFFGIGAYLMAIFMVNFEFPIWVSIMLATLLTTLIGTLIGLPFLRIRGPYFSISTLCFAFATQLFFSNWEFVGRSFGMYFPAVYTIDKFYWIMLILALITTLLVYRVRASHFGLSLLAIREDEEGAESIGINTVKTKLIAFLISVFVFSLVGGFWAWNKTYINPSSAVSILIQNNIIAMSLVGGLGTVFGPLIGVFAFMILHELLYTSFPELFLVIIGAIIIIVIRFMPEGILPYLSSLAKHRFPKKNKILSGKDMEKLNSW